MNSTRESPWFLLHLGLLVLLAVQAGMIAARVLSGDADALLGAPLGVMAATLVLAVAIVSMLNQFCYVQLATPRDDGGPDDASCIRTLANVFYRAIYTEENS